MAIYSFSIKPVSRLKGESIVKVAAYQSRGILYDEREEIQYDFTHKTDLLYTKIFLPFETPPEFFDRQTMWNAVDKAEKRLDARTGRAAIAALPNELTLEEQIRLVNEFVIEAFINQGICVDIAIHSGEKGNGINNPHVHILLTDRPIGRDGFCDKKNRDWNRKSYVCLWRELWAKAQNREFERKGLDVRVSYESLEVQQIDREPTKHLGRKVMEMKRRGKETDRNKENRAIIAGNQERERVQQERERRRYERKQERER